MQINLGNDGMKALLALRDNPDWKIFHSEFEMFSDKLIHDSISAPADHRVEATSYARAVRDLWVAMTGSVDNTRPAQTRQPGAMRK